MRPLELLGYGHTRCGERWGMEHETAAFCRMYFVLGGDCAYRDAAGEVRLAPGTLYFLPQYRPYSLMHSLDDPFFVLWQHVRLSGRTVRALTAVKILPRSAAAHILSAMTELTRGRLVDLVSDGASPLVGQLECLAEALISILESTNGPIFEAFDARLERAWQSLSKSGFDRASVAAMAAAANMERSYFSRLFTEQLGMPPQRWLQMARLNEAARLLLGGATVSEAGSAAGYTDPKAFCRAFAARTRCTPSQYRKSHILQP